MTNKCIIGENHYTGQSEENCFFHDKKCW